mmetsp:Transcript_6670/g.6604  ORF Transcript_6670/g.6604 Transcript_6670/m.6604 type:complete len:127 (+) Transcript_6670:34-414(+)
MGASSVFVVVLSSVFGLTIAIALLTLLLSRSDGWRNGWASIIPYSRSGSSRIEIEEYDETAPTKPTSHPPPPRRRSVDLGDLEIGRILSNELTTPRELASQVYGKSSRRGSLPNPTLLYRSPNMAQ